MSLVPTLGSQLMLPWKQTPPPKKKKNKNPQIQYLMYANSQRHLPLSSLMSGCCLTQIILVFLEDIFSFLSMLEDMLAQ
jgi:hypothetical protein